MRSLLQNDFFKEIYLQLEKITRIIPDKIYLKIVYRLRVGKKLNIDNPQTFNEKLQWLKLYDRKPIYTMMVDKYEVKKYVADVIGEQYIIPTLGVWNHFDEIDFNKLPDQFVLKCTHDSGGLVIVSDKNKLDMVAARKKIEKSLKRNFYWKGREWPYKGVVPRIIAEKYMEDGSNSSIWEYKLFTFEGVPLFMCVSERSEDNATEIISFSDMNGKQIPVKRLDYKPFEVDLSFPSAFNNMVKAAETISKQLENSNVRVETYCIDDNTFFLDIKLSCCGRMISFDSVSWGEKLGKSVKMPDMRGWYITNSGYIIWIHEMQTNNRGLTDYKIHCFNGEPKLIQCITERDPEKHTALQKLYDINWNDTSWTFESFPRSESEIAAPDNLEEMIACARKLSKDNKYMRVDMYEIGGKCYFGEITFFPLGGMYHYKGTWTANKDIELGRWIILPDKIKGTVHQ